MESTKVRIEATEKAVGRLASRITQTLAMKFFLEYSTFWGYFWGTVVLIFRAGLGFSRFPAAWGALAVPAFVVLAARTASRKTPSDFVLRGFLDQSSGSGGLLMASVETSLNNWWTAIPSISDPMITWKQRRAWVFLATAILFAAGAAYMPVRSRGENSPETMDVSRETERLSEQIKTLVEEDVISPEKAESLEKELESIRERALGSDPAATLEALDRMESGTKKAAQEAAEGSFNKAEAISKARNLLDALGVPQAQEAKTTLPELVATQTNNATGTSKDPDYKRRDLNERTRSDLLQKLASSVTDALDVTGAAMQDIEMKSLKALQIGSASLKDLQIITVKLEKCKEKIKGKLKKLKKSDLLDQKNLKIGESDEKSDGEDDDLSVLMLTKGDGSENGGASFINNNADGPPGSGGISRGRGDAPLNLNDKTDESGFKFKDQALPQTPQSSMQDSQSIGVAIGAPSVETPGGQSTGGALSTSGDSDGAAFTRKILPRHRATVKRYFNRK